MWPTAATFVLVALVVVLVGAAVGVWAQIERRRSRRTRVDAAASLMGRGHDLAHLTKKGQTATAKRLGVTAPPPPGTPAAFGGKAPEKECLPPAGLPLVKTLDGIQLYAGWEDVMVDIWGPRTGKTTSRAVPAILEAPGCVLVTSNKRDIVDATRDFRAMMPGGGQVWVFDPQGVCAEKPTWWWNPLSYVTNVTTARNLASTFASASGAPDAKKDSFFDPAGQELLAWMLLAAAKDRRPITDVYLWLTQPTNDRPAEILEAHGHPLPAASVREAVNTHDKQRGGVYGTAKKMVECLTNEESIAWVAPTGPADRRPQFSPADFVRTPSTLYSLSMEGVGSFGPMVTALTIAVTEAATDYATTQAGGRLAVPMVCVLDEAANVCRWAQLPNLYSHFGSRGIVMMTILQSWSQGEEVWGRAGMRKLWSAATIKLYGGGVSEVDFLNEVSQLIGEYELETTSVSNSASGRSVSISTRKERKLDVAALGSLPKGRAVLIASGTPPVLGRTIPWMTGPHAIAVEASIKAHDPKGSETIAAAAESMNEVAAFEAVA